MKTKNQGDDLFLDRLFSYLRGQFSFEIKTINPIRNRVLKIESDDNVFIIKGFPSYHRLKLQETFTASLKKEGFAHTYSFLNPTKKDELLFFEQTYYGCLQYIEPAAEAFSYTTLKDRLDGLNILQNYHLVTSNLVNRYQTLIGRFKILEKWRNRTAKFLENIPIIRFFIQKEMIDEMLKWADWSLKGLEKEIESFRQAPDVILHGDVAHHNFLRSKKNELFLIDFDLISIGPACCDYLQYTNRILPSLEWSLEELVKIEKLRPFLSHKGFIYSLAYPTDIFREWNRIVRESMYKNPENVRPILDLSVNQFMERQCFVRDLKSIVND